MVALATGAVSAVDGDVLSTSAGTLTRSMRRQKMVSEHAVITWPTNVGWSHAEGRRSQRIFI